jgi:flagellar hook-associated protein 2
VNDVIEGVTITLKDAPSAPDNTATLTVSRDTGALTAKVSAFVTAYNAVVDMLKSQQSYDAETKVAGPLQGDGTASMIRRQLGNLVRDKVAGRELYSRPADLGIAVNESGQLEVDSSVLSRALTENFSEVVRFFGESADGSEGFAARLAEGLDKMLDSHDGSLSVRKEGIQQRIDKLQDQMEVLSERIAASEKRMRAQFNRLESLMSQYQSTAGLLSQQLQSLQNLNNYISNKK